MKEIKLMGRGGQGAVTGAQIIASAAHAGGLFAQTFPHFGSERRGAPVFAFVRFDEKKLHTHQGVKNPDVVIVMDHHLFQMMDPLIGVNPEGTLIVNCKDAKDLPEGLSERVKKIYTLDANNIAAQVYGEKYSHISNVIATGAYCAAEGDFAVDRILEVLPDFFDQKRVAMNEQAVHQGFQAIEEYHG